MTALRVAVLPADEGACGFYRMKLPAGAVAAARPDWDVRVYRPGDIQLAAGADGRLWAVQGLPVDDLDVVVMQRVATLTQVSLVRWLQEKGVAVVVDADDAMWCVDKENTAWKYWNQGPFHWRHLDSAAKHADLVTVTTQHLAHRYGEHGRVDVLPNCVPGELENYLESARPALDQTTTVGWAGFTATHPGDLMIMGNTMKELQARTGCLVRVVGDAEGASLDWGMPVEKVNPVPIGMPYYTALTTLDIGVVPLRSHTFNKSKSYLKALEFAACGVVVVASDTPANRQLARTVPIHLASSPREWAAHLLNLVTRPDPALAVTARSAVFRYHTYEANAERWANAWERAFHRRARMATR